MQGAATTVKKVTLELGGKSPNIVLEDADLDLAIPGSLFAFRCTTARTARHAPGSSCPGPGTTSSANGGHARSRKIGDPSDPATDVGPVVSASASAYEGYVETARPTVQPS